jgi:hypothetical protein
LKINLQPTTRNLKFTGYNNEVLLLQQQGPIIVKVVEQPVRETSIVDVIVGAVGVIGVGLMCAALLGAVLGGVLILLKRWRVQHGYERDPVADNPYRISPF